MIGARKLHSETEEFWQDGYQVSGNDLDLITGLILDSGKPQPLSVLVSTVITARHRDERDAIARQARSGRLYQPKGHYELGQTLVFSAMDFAVGQVVSVRDGQNPRVGPFSVIRIAFADGSAEREFATDFDHLHPLNRPAEELILGGAPQMSEEDLVQRFDQYVAPRLEQALVADSDFLHFDGRWFLRELLPDMNLEYLLNLAEAMIDEGGRPLATRDMLPRLGVDPGVPEEVQLFALNCALTEDQRFDNVSLTQEPAWFLRGLQPEAVFHRPAVLDPSFRARGGEHIGLTMLDLVEELGDELDDVEGAPLRDLESVHFEVSFPHLYAGTMPATAQFLRMLPLTHVRHLRVTLVDARTGERFDAWVVPGEGYVCGLGDWYKSLNMPVGGQVSVAPTDEPFTFSLSTGEMRVGRNEWIVTATVRDDAFSLQMLPPRSTVMVRSDRHMLVGVPDVEAIARLVGGAAEEGTSLSAVIRVAFGELAKFKSGLGVHAKSIYSVANLIRRTGAVAVFAELTRRACYDPVGGGFWTYDPGLEGKTYRTAEEMRERLLSHRQDLVKDPVIEYRGR